MSIRFVEGSQENDTKQGIDWTNGIDELFVKTEEDSYGKDDQEPYMWMYFGSTLGFVRHYPANQWQVEATAKRFPKPVNFSHSVVHVPAEIYVGGMCCGIYV